MGRRKRLPRSTRTGIVVLAVLGALSATGCQSSPPTATAQSGSPRPTATGTAQAAASQAVAPETPTPTPEATADPFPWPACPGPARAATPPEVLAHVGGGPAIVATSGSFTTMTCSTTGVADAVGRPPEVPLLADPGDAITLTVPVGWAFTRWEGSDSPVVGEGANVWPPSTVAGRPRSIDIPVPGRTGDSIVGLTVVLISDDDRTVIEQALELLVRVG